LRLVTSAPGAGGAICRRPIQTAISNSGALKLSGMMIHGITLLSTDQPQSEALVAINRSGAAAAAI